MSDTTIVAAGVVVADGVVHRPGWVEQSGGRIIGVGAGSPPRPADSDHPRGLLVPGFVDMHVHGGGGASYTDGIDEQVRAAAAFHRTHGTTTTVTSTVSATRADLRAIVPRLRELVVEGVSAGIHLEGPWISHARCGAHDPGALRNPESSEIDEILDLADGTVAMVTLAPELPGAMDAVDRLVAAGVTVAVGHTDATYDQVREAIERGARVATHLFNAMAPLGHREPGPPLALMEDPRVVVELVGDGVHLHPAVVRDVQRAVGFDRAALVTDAMVATGMPDGAYRLGSLDVTVDAGVARVAETGAIAGSTATMDRLFARTVAGLSAGAGNGGAPSDDVLIGAAAMTAGNPARVLRRPDIGVLAVGRRADLVVLDEDFRVAEVLSGG
ncbi:N-acetylglucosamine-6-phosphate deacetylase [Gordonia neofelifaecis]|uniref:N-acetylglucosamine-6-phosphate deacetylase n=1 Tax=Gordonia neofelifaecis NRRL B-59395 TaxID=644548 RepID=F1YL12_9ACTN|nr:N-acetylglucosamine-6-phosphate deacetylase [Gordonia neofelifaecis]EGD54617.1 N-acetylglucosamine-6-phosphate deacetylase [Gordonia neofelifaecis NRRL B-59395]